MAVVARTAGLHLVILAVGSSVENTPGPAVKPDLGPSLLLLCRSLGRPLPRRRRLWRLRVAINHLRSFDLCRKPRRVHELGQSRNPCCFGPRETHGVTFGDE